MLPLSAMAGARLARVPAMADIAAAAELIVPLHEVAVIHGEHGTGKTTALESYLSRQPLPVTRLTLPPRQSSRDIVRWLHRLVVTPDDLAERDLQDDLAEILADTDRIVVVEHAHRLSGEAAAQLEWLHNRPGHRWALFLVGGPKTLSAVGADALLGDAVCATVAVRPLSGNDLHRALQDMHELFLGAGTELLAEIDARVCHGLLGRWARLLQHALHLQERLVSTGRDAPVLDRGFARAVIASLPTTITK